MIRIGTVGPLSFSGKQNKLPQKRNHPLRKSTAALATATALAGSAHAQTAVDWSDVAEKAQCNTVVVHSKPVPIPTVMPNGEFGFMVSRPLGSGFFVGRKDGKPIIVTNDHVTSGGTPYTGEDISKITDSTSRKKGPFYHIEFFTDNPEKESPNFASPVILPNGEEARLSQGEDGELNVGMGDLVLLEMPKNTKLPPCMEGLPIGDSDALKNGESTLSVGTPYGMPFALAPGTMSIKNLPDKNGIPLQQIAASFYPGVSGGPTINRKGQVIGVNVMSSNPRANYGWTIPSNLLKALLKIADVRGYKSWAEEKQLAPLVNQKQREILLSNHMPAPIEPTTAPASNVLTQESRSAKK